MFFNDNFSSGTIAHSFSKLMIARIVALLLGVFFVLGVGFSNSNTIHNAAHDARHAFAFPCH
jgi:cobalt transporter subunit CbtB